MIEEKDPILYTGGEGHSSAARTAYCRRELKIQKLLGGLRADKSQAQHENGRFLRYTTKKRKETPTLQ